MTKELLGVKLDSLSDPICAALKKYQEISEDAIEFDLEAASELILTPEKTTSARSESIIKHLGETVATLYVIALKPGDGTGAYNSPYQQGTLYTSKYPTDTRYYPRGKKTIDTEVHLTLVSSLINSSYEPTLFAGHLSLLGLANRQITQIGYLGQNQAQFDCDMWGTENAKPTSTLTTGYHSGLETINPFSPIKMTERFGDPHAVINETNDTIQVCGFIGMPADNGALRMSRRIIQSLGANEFKKQ